MYNWGNLQYGSVKNMNNKIDDILDAWRISRWGLITALVEELRSKQISVNAKTLKHFSKDKWKRYPKLQRIYGESDNLYDALMDKFELSYE